MTFTAAEVRRLADELRTVQFPETLRYAQALMAYADRLEQDEREEASATKLADALTDKTNLFYQNAREEGRREVYAEIAERDPAVSDDGDSYCFFCGAIVDILEHEPDCLWLKAQQIRTPASPDHNIS